MATKDVKEFNGWFNRSYMRLKERLSIYGKINEDAFHDAYLAVRKQVMFASGGIEELESYFFGCYRRIVSIPSTPFFYIKKALADFVYQLKPLLITQRKSFCNCREATSRSPLRSDRLGGAVRFP